jgi:hypothetical protein
MPQRKIAVGNFNLRYEFTLSAQQTKRVLNTSHSNKQTPILIFDRATAMHYPGVV